MMRTPLPIILTAVLGLGGFSCHLEEPSSVRNVRPVLDWYLDGHPPSLDPSRLSTANEDEVLGLVFDKILNIDEYGHLIDGVTTYRVEPSDERIVTLTIVGQHEFSDGKPVKSEDIVFSLHRFASQSPSFSGRLQHVKKAEVLDDRTVKVMFDRANPWNAYALTFFVMPKHLYLTKEPAVPIGSGPYTFQPHATDQVITLLCRACDDTQFATIRFHELDAKTAWLALQRGEIDVKRLTIPEWLEFQRQPELRERFNIYEGWDDSINAIVWNNSRPYLDTQTRTALTQAINRKRIVTNLFESRARVPGSFVPYGQPFHDPSLTPLTYMPKSAPELLQKRLLDEQLTIIYPAGSQRISETMQVVQYDLRQAGVAAQLLPLESATFFERVLAGKFDGAYLAYSADGFGDWPSFFGSQFMPPNGTNLARYQNPAVDWKFDEMSRATTAATYGQALIEVQRIVADDQPWTLLNQPLAAWAVKKEVDGVKMSPAGLGITKWHPGERNWRHRKNGNADRK